MPDATFALPQPLAESPAGAAEERTSRRSVVALDATAFFLADVVDGLGPFLVISLKADRGWSAGDAGMAMSLMLVGTVLFQGLAGGWIDVTRHKRVAVAGAALAIAAMSILLSGARTRLSVFALQFSIGAAVTIFPTALGALSLGLVGRRQLPQRIGRNEACFHAGNVYAAVLAGIAGWRFGSAGVFYGVAVMAVCSAASVLRIRESEIDHTLARGADFEESQSQSWTAILREPKILWFTAAIVLFHCANAAMLPLVGQKLAVARPEVASTLMATCIIVAQVTMIPVALLTSRVIVRARKPALLAGFAVLPIRGLLYTVSDAPGWLISIQILDGVAAGILGVATLLTMADLTRGTGRYNFAQGMAATAIGLGAALSNAVTGRVVDFAGFDVAFRGLACVAMAALGVVWFRVRERVTDPM